MVQTTKGPAPVPHADDSQPQDRTDAGDRRARGELELDDATWGQIMAQAQTQQTTPGEVVRRTIENAYGRISPEGAWHSGQADDPAMANRLMEAIPDSGDQSNTKTGVADERRTASKEKASSKK